MVTQFRLNSEGIPEVTPQHTQEVGSQVKIIDVRRPNEFTGELGHIAGAKLVTLETELAATLPTWPRDACYIFVCRSGGRSAHATAMAQTLGFKKVYNMEGGMIRWNAEKLPVER